MRLTTPIHKEFLFNGCIAVISQLFGENKNQLFYGPLGHQGLDFRTKSQYKFEKTGAWKWKDDHWTDGSFKRVKATDMESIGFIPTVATHDGILSTNFFTTDKRNGYAVWVTAEPENVKGGKLQFRTLHFHLESPWRSLETFKQRAKLRWKDEFVRRGSIIAICDNTGKYTTGPHLHFELQKRFLGTNGKWSEWERIDPLPYFDDQDVIYESTGKKFYKGKEITKEEKQELINKWPKVI